MGPKRGLCSEGSMDMIEFPIFSIKGFEAELKIDSWLNDFQKLPYVALCEDFSNLNPENDIAEKRIVGASS